MSKAASLDIFEITNLTCDLRELAEGSTARYDGWGACVVAR